MLGLVIIAAAAGTCVACILIGAGFTNLDHEEFRAILVGILSGALTSDSGVLRVEGGGGCRP